MRVIEVETIAFAHEQAIKAILEDNIELNTKHGKTYEHTEGLDIIIKHPNNEPYKSSAYKFPGLNEYAKQLISIIDTDFDYNCGNRWRDYFTPSILGTCGDGDGYGFDQLEMVVKEIKKDPSSRRAIVSSLYPPIDSTKKHIPCISLLQFLFRQNKLNLIAYIRSNDMLSAYGADAYALTAVMNYVSLEAGLESGYLETISRSAHLYPERDAPELLNFRKIINW